MPVVVFGVFVGILWLAWLVVSWFVAGVIALAIVVTRGLVGLYNRRHT